MQRALAAAIVAALIAAPAGSGGAAKPKQSDSPRSAVDTARVDTTAVHVGPSESGAGAFVAWPAGRDTAPAVIVIHEWWGLNDQIRGVARRLAKQGYVAIVPDLYHGKVAVEAENAHELMRGLERGRALEDLDGTVQWLKQQPRAAHGRIGVVGFCMGGGLSLAFALHDPDLAAAVMFYGVPLETDPEKLASLEAPLLANFGADDQGIPGERVEQFREALKKADKSAQVYVYPKAGHAFMNETRASYRKDAAALAWKRTLAFFREHLE